MSVTAKCGCGCVVTTEDGHAFRSEDKVKTAIVKDSG